MLPLEQFFARLRVRKGRAFMPYVTAGFPSAGAMPGVFSMLRDAGADVLELGVPFSDPIADGATIQHTSQVALERGADLASSLRACELAATAGLRVVLMSYANPVWQAGLARFARRASSAGAQGLIVPDLPLEESAAWSAACASERIALVLMAAPTTPDVRLAEIGARTRGFLYYVSLTGVTGERSKLPAGLAARVRAVRSAVRVPVCVGFGIGTPVQAAAAAVPADGVIVGSALVRRLGGWPKNRAATAFWARSMARAVHRAISPRAMSLGNSR